MSRKKTTEEFIKEAKEIHGDKFDYSSVEYVNDKVPVTLTCEKGHLSEQTPNNHLRGKGCQQCYNLKRSEEKRINSESKVKSKVTPTETFIRKAILVHGDDFKYDLVNYIDAKTKVTLICNEKGHTFDQSPSNHLCGHGCIHCARIVQADSKRITREDFIRKSKEVHGDTYSYDDSIYTESNKKVTIFCKIHQNFTQIANAHMAGKGCSKCAVLNTSFSRQDYVKMSKGRPTSLYLLRCFNDEEDFYKLGKTFQSVKTRYGSTSKMPYSYEVISEYFSDAESIFDLEIKLHKKYASYSYAPNIFFGGHMESYNLSLPIQEIINL